MNVSLASLIISLKISYVNCPFYMNGLLLQKGCYIVFDYLFWTFFNFNCLGGLNVAKITYANIAGLKMNRLIKLNF